MITLFEIIYWQTSETYIVEANQITNHAIPYPRTYKKTYSHAYCGKLMTKNEDMHQSNVYHVHLSCVASRRGLHLCFWQSPTKKPTRTPTSVSVQFFTKSWPLLNAFLIFISINLLLAPDSSSNQAAHGSKWTIALNDKNAHHTWTFPQKTFLTICSWWSALATDSIPVPNTYFCEIFVHSDSTHRTRTFLQKRFLTICSSALL